jgi:hypothetical protein
MPLSQDLFSGIKVPDIRLEMDGLLLPEMEDRRIVIRIKEGGQRSISAVAWVSCYSPEAGIIRAFQEVVMRLGIAQEPIGQPLLREELLRAVALYVDPF